MNTKFFILSIIQLILAFFLAITVTYFTNKYLHKFFSKWYKIKTFNFSSAILSASVVFSAGYLISGILQPAFNAIRIFGHSISSNADFFFTSTKYLLIFLGIGTGVSVIVMITGLYIFTKLTRGVKEFEEIKKDNLAVGLITGVIIIVIALFVKDSIVLLLESIIPYPKAFIP